MPSDRIERRARSLSGLPRRVDADQRWWRRVAHNPWTWVAVGTFCLYGLGLLVMYLEFSASITKEIAEVTAQLNQPTELTAPQLHEALIGSARAAAGTLGVYFLLFCIFDRLRPTSWVMKFQALGWGIGIATLVSWHVNSWMSSMLNIQGAGDPTSANRAAIFVAPFVEEAAKATIIFWLAMVLRYRLVTAFQTITLTGLSAVGFAFTENIIYYTRAFVYAAKIQGVDPEAARGQLVVLRGIMTSFGHPLFTTFVGIGVFVAVRTRSKLVRILAPLAGFCLAATGHMTFNGFASAGASEWMLTAMGGFAILMLLVWLWRQLRTERAQIQARLIDYLQMGWLRPRDAEVFISMRARLKLAFAALLRGPRTFTATLRLQADITELAYLRSWMTRGTIDAAGHEREAELILEIADLRGRALDEPQGLPIRPESWHLPRSISERLARRRALRGQPIQPVALPAPGGWAPGVPVGAGVAPAPAPAVPIGGWAPPTGAPRP